MQKYLKSLNPVESVRVAIINQDVVTYRLKLRNDPEANTLFLKLLMSSSSVLPVRSSRITPRRCSRGPQCAGCSDDHGGAESVPGSRTVKFNGAMFGGMTTSR